MSVFSDDGLDNDLDHDSLYAESHTESLADGAISSKGHPEGSFVEQPSIQADADNEAPVEAGQRASRAETSPPAQSPVSFIETIRWPQETAPVLDAGPAPPDYAAATAPGPRDEDSSSRLVGYGSVPWDASSPARERPAEGQNELMWPLGSRNNALVPGFPFRHTQDCSGDPLSPLSQHSGPPASLSGPFRLINGGPFAPRHEPEAMVDTSVHDASMHETHPLLRHRQNKQSRRWLMRIRRTCCEPLSILNAFLILAIISLTLLLIEATTYGYSSDRGTSDDSPVKNPVSDDDRLDVDYDWSNGTLPVHAMPDSQCVFEYYSRSASFGFTNIASFWFSEMIGVSTRTRGEIGGKIWILPAPPGQDVDIKGWFSYAAAKPIFIDDITHRITENGVILALADGAAAPRGCIDVAVGIYIKKDVSFTEFDATTLNLDVEVMDGFEVDNSVQSHSTHGRSTLHTRQGDAKISYWSSRELYVDSRSGSISGRFALRDLLSISSTSGSIDAEVSPRMADRDKPLPAKLSVTSSSGSINVKMELDDLPERDFKTYVRGRSGSVKGTVIHGSETEITTGSGTIDLNVLPYRAEESGGSRFTTSSGSGTTNVHMLAPYTSQDSQAIHSDTGNNVIPHVYKTYQPEEIGLDMLRSSHSSASGTLNLIYPKEWEGTIEGHSYSGSIKVAGDGIHQIIDQDLGVSKRHYVGRKGSADSRLEFSTTSGSVDICIGGS
ncbi:hypothetical protein Tdes44962_MAKER02048 [Teratosphaeria destructans]|uniref:Adhesin domain-containing protein n=1 Tax=Teratosphaeria destructans TaxID=418781 RepID=A0A9W7W3S4_9PEZI|nr:hypothetical protein Tdes44962_MAKER02048 [Teratosphaeria destructans]